MDSSPKLANASHGVIEALQRIAGPRLQAGQRQLTPLLEFGDRHADFTGHGVNRFAAQQPKDHAAFAAGRPRLISAAPEALPVALRAPSSASGATACASAFFNINHSSLGHTFYPKSVSGKTGGAALSIVDIQ
ncbi:MAG: hypothetical protein LBV73_25385 [Paraburkholderia sp.]|jgi:hypothetical protein|nr:hypothetical protein [Paraburkholderia sp.]